MNHISYEPFLESQIDPNTTIPKMKFPCQLIQTSQPEQTGTPTHTHKHNENMALPANTGGEKNFQHSVSNLFHGL